MSGVIEGLVVNGVTEILKKLIPVISEQIGLASDAKEELEKLKHTLEMIKAVVTDAERRQITEEAVKLWLRRLKDFAYDADDILDAYLYKCIQKHELMKHKRDQVFYYASPSTNPVLSRFKLGNKIRKINLKFDQIALEKNQLGLQPYASPLGRTGDVIDESINRKTYAFLGDSENIVGRETDKHNILKMLLTTDPVEKVTVIPIVGMGGTGKTTLVQLIYNDKLLENCFESKIWVCVSDDFSIKRLLKDVIESITKTKCDDLSNIDVLVEELHKNLGGKKYLLVLDDLWNRNASEWARLKELLSVGALGSKIIITTRIEDVAKIVVGNHPIYNLEVLKEDECQSIFKKLAFGSGGPVETPILSDIANQLVKKCRGLPLAAKTLGSLMHSKKDERDWVFMRDNEILNIPEDQSEIFRILKLSYDHLSSHLKQCFSYCSIFPKDHRIERETLVQLWVAEGFIQPYEGNDKLALEDIGNDYFFSLLRNSLLQDIEIDESGDVKACKIHDLVHDLAQTVSGPHECMIVEASKIGDISDVRRLCLLNLDDKKSSARVSDALKKAKKLRTLFVSSNKAITMNMIKELFHNNTLLRVLDLSRTSFKEVPSEISNLKHLRYLDLSFMGSSHMFVQLPNLISTLYHLLTLKITKHRLPKDTNKLINLRHLISSFDDVYGWRRTPRRLGLLTCLRTLNEFTVNNGDGYGIEELGSLNSIGGDLRICYLQNVKGGSDVASSANLGGKPNLRSLSLEWNDSPGNENDEMVLEGLQPHPHLKSLRIAFFGGAKLPTWMSLSSCPPNLVMLKLLRCKGIEQLPSLGELPSLRILSIDAMDGVRYLGKEFHGTAAFPSLKEFTLVKMKNLEEWVVEEQQQQFPHLEKLQIRYCARLKVVPTFFPSLTELLIDEIEGGMTVKAMVTRNLTSLTKVDLNRVEELQFLPQGLLLNNTALQSLEISNCLKLEGFIIPKEEKEEEDIQQQVLLSEDSPPPGPLLDSSLEYLKLYNCPVLTFLPDLRCCTSLRELTVERCEELTNKSLSDEDDLKKWVELQQQQPQFPSTTISSFPHLLERLQISYCPRLKVAPTFFPFPKNLSVHEIKDIILKSMVTRTLTFLVHINISEVEELQFLPQGLLLNNTALRSLKIYRCFKFEGFIIPKEEEEEEDTSSPDLGSNNNNNSSLKSLELLYCPVLTFLPDLCYFTSLQILIIEYCKNLMKPLPGEDELKKSLPSLKKLRLGDIWKSWDLALVKSWWRRLGICNNDIFNILWWRSPSLKEFTLDWMINLEEWVVEEQQFLSATSTSFPYLKKLVISYCHRLKVVPTFFPSLTELSIVRITGGMTVGSMVTRNLTSLTKVDISEVEELQFLPQGLLLNNNTLQSLAISHCPNFEGFIIPEEEEEEDILQVVLSEDSPPPPGPLVDHSSNNNNSNNSSLKSLELRYCPVPTFLPNLWCCTSLRELTIEGCPVLNFPLPQLTKSLSNEDDLKKWVELLQQQQFPSTTIYSFPHLEKLKISNCPRLKVAPALFPSLKDLSVHRIKDMIVRSMLTRTLTFLVYSRISYVEELQFLPQGLLLNSNSLQYLRVDCCRKFEGFVIPKEEDIQKEVLSEDPHSPPDIGSNNSNNSSIKSLELHYCPVLTFLPDLCYFTSLQILIIEDCKNLMQSLPSEDELKKCLSSLEKLRME